MKQRLYFLLNDIGSTRTVVDRLLLDRIHCENIHVIAREGTDLDNLPAATLMQSSDIVHSIEVGLVVGGITGMVGGVVATIAMSLGSMVGGVLLTTSLFGALFGFWVAGMIGSNVRNVQLKPYEAAIDHGKFLLMVDVPRERVEEITAKIEHQYHVHLQDIEPTIPAFP